MGGIIQGFMGGGSRGTAIAGEMLLRDQLARERDEVSDLRRRALRMDEQASRQEFKTGERKAVETFEASQGELDRQSRETIAGMQPAKNPQLIKYTNSKGYEQEGVLQDKGDGTYMIIKPENGEVVEDNITSEQLKNKAAVMNTAEGRDSDWIPFNEYSKGDPEVRAAVVKDKATQGQGIVGGAMQRPQAAPKEQAAPRAQAAPYPEGTELKGKDGKLYVVKNGKPVPKEPQ